jgi:hypothetical protein
VVLERENLSESVNILFTDGKFTEELIHVFCISNLTFRLLLCALSAGSLRRTTLLRGAEPAPSTSWMTILMASPSTDCCLVGNGGDPGHGISTGGATWTMVGRVVGSAPRLTSAAMSGLEGYPMLVFPD